MYINLPSKNSYRRPATYTSKGYKTRRMAVDFAVPLIFNVKCAKLLAEALVRKMPLDVSTVDFKSSYTAHIFPSLVNISGFVPTLVNQDKKAFAEATQASISGGFTTVLILPFGTAGHIADEDDLSRTQTSASGSAHCNYALNIVATPTNLHSLDEDAQAEAKYLFVPFNAAFSELPMSQQISSIAAHFASWPTEKPVVTDAKGSDLASLLLLASLHSRSVHITDVRHRDDLLLISLSKSKQLKVTCDVSVYALFFSREQFPGSNCLPTKDDQQALWNNLNVIDAFSVGTLPFELANELGHEASARSGVEETLPLLLSAVGEGRLTLNDIKERLHDNPVRIFGLPEQPHTQVEVVVDRKSSFIRRNSIWSPLTSSQVVGSIHRVVIHGQTVFLDGTLFSAAMGRDISSATITRTVDRASRMSFSARRPSLAIDHSASTVSLGMTLPKNLGDGASISHLGTLPLAGSQALQHSLTTHSLTVAPQVFTPLTPHPSFHRRHILSVKQFTHQDIHDLFNIAHEMRLQVERSGTLDILKGKVLCTLFYEPSTRTSSSFDAAMKRCGGEVIQVSAEQSSVTKGETLPDTIRTLGCYADAIVIRHPEVGSAQTAAKFSPVPILNAGDGIGEHPTQVYSVAICGLICLTVFD